MSDLDFSRCRLTPFQHQREDTEVVVKNPFVFIASEMRTGKTKITVDAAQFLYLSGDIDRVLVIAPSPVVDVWYNSEWGEIKKNAWNGLDQKIINYHSRLNSWDWGNGEGLVWVITNYEFIRSPIRLKAIKKLCTPDTLLILDESSFVKNYSSQQTKACMELRQSCGRVILINGTPIFHSPLDLFSQGNLLHPRVLECKYITHFKARYAIQEPVLGFGGKVLTDPYGKAIQKVKGWTNLEDLQRRFAPYTIRRLQKDCLDLPPKLDPVILTAKLTESWPIYQKMKNDLVVWLSDSTVASSSTAATKVMRLSQITSGLVGGVEDANVSFGEADGDLLASLDLPAWNYEPSGNANEEIKALISQIKTPSRYTKEDIERAKQTAVPDAKAIDKLSSGPTTQTVGREKLDVLLWLVEGKLEADPNLHLVIWCRFKQEMFRIFEEVGKKFPQFEMAKIHGGQSRNGQERQRALALLHPDTSPTGPVCLVGIEGTGSFGLNMTASHTCITMSSGYSPGRVTQTLDRVYGPGQTNPIAYYNIVATGPKGQKTIDHTILEARLHGQDVADWTAAAWVKALREE